MGPGAKTCSILKTFLQQYQPTSLNIWGEGGGTQLSQYFLSILVLKGKGCSQPTSSQFLEFIHLQNGATTNWRAAITRAVYKAAAADMWKLVPCVRGPSVTLHGPWKCLKAMMTLGCDWLCLDSAWTSRGEGLCVPCQFSDLSTALLLPTSRLCVSAAPWSEHHDMNLEGKKPTTLQKRAVILSFVLLMFFFLYPPSFLFFFF